jgi:hypothetical protein
MLACDDLYVTGPATTKPTFRKDVLPIFRETCNGSSCHGGEPDSAQGKLWLGRPTERPLSDEEVRFVYDSLIDIQADATPVLALVRKGKPRDSWLMLKLDDCLEYPALDCRLTEDPTLPCGSRMPNIGDLLTESDRLTIRAWIETGAKF